VDSGCLRGDGDGAVTDFCESKHTSHTSYSATPRLRAAARLARRVQRVQYSEVIKTVKYKIEWAVDDFTSPSQNTFSAIPCIRAAVRKVEGDFKTLTFSAV
jgi:hypothetical protein